MLLNMGLNLRDGGVDGGVGPLGFQALPVLGWFCGTPEEIVHLVGPSPSPSGTPSTYCSF